MFTSRLCSRPARGQIASLREASNAQAATAQLEAQGALLLSEREALSKERLELDTAKLSVARELVAMRAEIADHENAMQRSRAAGDAERATLESTRAEVGAMLEIDRRSYADALHAERASAASAAAAAEAAHAEAIDTLRRQMLSGVAESTAAASAAAAAHRQEVETREAELLEATRSAAEASRRVIEAEEGLEPLKRQLSAAQERADAAIEELVGAREQVQGLG